MHSIAVFTKECTLHGNQYPTRIKQFKVLHSLMHTSLSNAFKSYSLGEDDKMADSILTEWFDYTYHSRLLDMRILDSCFSFFIFSRPTLIHSYKVTC